MQEKGTVLSKNSSTAFFASVCCICAIWPKMSKNYQLKSSVSGKSGANAAGSAVSRTFIIPISCCKVNGKLCTSRKQPPFVKRLFVEYHYVVGKASDLCKLANANLCRIAFPFVQLCRKGAFPCGPILDFAAVKHYNTGHRRINPCSVFSSIPALSSPAL